MSLFYDLDNLNQGVFGVGCNYLIGIWIYRLHGSINMNTKLGIIDKIQAVLVNGYYVAVLCVLLLNCQSKRM